jgi:hypothetical protein
MEEETVKPKTVKLTKDQCEYLARYFFMYKKAYYFITGNKLNTVEEIMNIILSDKITFEDIYNVFLDERFTALASEADEIYWDDNMEKFECMNYFPDHTKNVGDGSWIKIRNENGFEIHYAKKSGRKRRYEEEYSELVSKYSRVGNKTIQDLTDALSGDVGQLRDEKVSKANEAKMEKLQNELKELSLRIVIGIPLYEVKIYRTKSSIEYYLPYQYELVEDIAEFSDAYVNNIPGVHGKTLYTSQNADAVFYLQSRGISKKNAEMMAALKQTYFVVNMRESMEAYNNIMRKQIEFVKM